jgi:hypothetical protein
MKGWCWHRWTRWTEVKASIDKRFFQLRTCEKCGKTQVRLVEP